MNNLVTIKKLTRMTVPLIKDIYEKQYLSVILFLYLLEHAESTRRNRI